MCVSFGTLECDKLIGVDHLCLILQAGTQTVRFSIRVPSNLSPFSTFKGRHGPCGEAQDVQP